MASDSLRAKAEGKWNQLLPLLGVDSKYLQNRHGPCPSCEGKDRYRFHNRSGHGDYYCNGCGAGDGFDLVMKIKGIGFKEAAVLVEGLVGKVSREIVKPKARTSLSSMRSLWGRGVHIQAGDEVGTYLASRNLQGPYPPSLAYAGSCKLVDDTGDKYLPAMLAKVSGPDGKPVNIHRTYLLSDGGKVRKMMAADVPKGSAIRLGAVSPVLGIAEGIETALAVKALFGVTCWSCISADILTGFVVPEGVRELRIYGDHDHNFVGQAASYGLAKRVANMKDGPEVSVHIPERWGYDWADVLANKCVPQPPAKESVTYPNQRE